MLVGLLLVAGAVLAVAWVVAILAVMFALPPES